MLLMYGNILEAFIVVPEARSMLSLAPMTTRARSMVPQLTLMRTTCCTKRAKTSLVAQSVMVAVAELA
eukprot:1723-Heterococcus_DN1.PRE.2